MLNRTAEDHLMDNVNLRDRAAITRANESRKHRNDNHNWIHWIYLKYLHITCDWRFVHQSFCFEIWMHQSYAMAHMALGDLCQASIWDWPRDFFPRNAYAFEDSSPGLPFATTTATLSQPARPSRLIRSSRHHLHHQRFPSSSRVRRIVVTLESLYWRCRRHRNFLYDGYHERSHAAVHSLSRRPTPFTTLRAVNL